MIIQKIQTSLSNEPYSDRVGHNGFIFYAKNSQICGIMVWKKRSKDLRLGAKSIREEIVETIVQSSGLKSGFYKAKLWKRFKNSTVIDAAGKIEVKVTVKNYRRRQIRKYPLQNSS